MNLRQRTAYSVAAIFGLWFLISHVSSAVAQNYTLNSLFSVNEGQQSTGPIQPSINNLGQAAYARTVFDGVNPEVIFIHDGITETPFFNLTAAGFFTTPANVVINDNGAVAAQVGARPGSVCPSNVGSCLIRINADQSVTVLATAGAFGGGTADFGSFDQQISMNNSGQVAEGVTYPNATTAIVRIDETGITEIARPTATLINFSRPSINNSGVVAFTAQDLSGGCSPSNICVFSGTGGPLTKEGVQPPGGCRFRSLYQQQWSGFGRGPWRSERSDLHRSGWRGEHARCRKRRPCIYLAFKSAKPE